MASKLAKICVYGAEKQRKQLLSQPNAVKQEEEEKALAQVGKTRLLSKNEMNQMKKQMQNAIIGDLEFGILDETQNQTQEVRQWKEKRNKMDRVCVHSRR